MKIHPQIISQNDTPVFVVLPYAEYEHLLERIEDVEDIEAAQLAPNERSERFSFALVKRLADHENPIKVYREYRQLSQTDLAHKVNVSKQYLSLLEKGKRKGSVSLLKEIAKTLNIDLEDLIGK